MHGMQASGVRRVAAWQPLLRLALPAVIVLACLAMPSCADQTGAAGHGVMVPARASTRKLLQQTQQLGPDALLWSPLGARCVHPEGGSGASNNVGLVLFANCTQHFFRYTSGGAIQYVHTGKCLHPEGGAVQSNGQRVVLYDGCDTTANANIKWERTPGGQIRHVKSGYCLHVQGAASADGTPLVFWNSCKTAPQNTFTSLTLGFQIRSRLSSKCVHPEGGNGTSNGTGLVLFKGCPSHWFRQLPNGAIIYQPTGKCLHPKGGTVKRNGQRVVLHDGCDAATNSYLKWQLVTVKSGIVIRHVRSGYCLHVQGASSADNTPLVFIKTCTPQKQNTFTFKLPT